MLVHAIKLLCGKQMILIITLNPMTEFVYDMPCVFLLHLKFLFDEDL